MFSCKPLKPDMNALTLAPFSAHKEVIIIFYNRCGFKSGVAYFSTSAVLRIKGGEVSVYGLFKRGVEKLLVIDTNNLLFARLVQVDSDQSNRFQDPPSVFR